MRFLRYLLLAVVGLILVLVAMANQSPVTVNLLPSDIGDFVGLGGAIEVPLFLLLLGAAAGGLVIGFVWEWLREHKHRATARAGAKQVNALSREVTQLRNAQSGPKDEVLALLESTSVAGNR